MKCEIEIEIEEMRELLKSSIFNIIYILNIFNTNFLLEEDKMKCENLTHLLKTFFEEVI